MGFSRFVKGATRGWRGRSSFTLIRKNAYLVTLALVSPRRNRRSRAQTSIFTIEDQHFLVQMAPQASWPPDVPAESLEARSPQPGVLSQASSARIPQPGVLSKDSSARISHPGVSSQESSARIPQPGVVSQDSSARNLQPGILSQESSARIPQPGILSKDSSARRSQSGILSRESSAKSPQPGFLGQESPAGSPRWSHLDSWIFRFPDLQTTLPAPLDKLSDPNPTLSQHTQGSNISQGALAATHGPHKGG